MPLFSRRKSRNHFTQSRPGWYLKQSKNRPRLETLEDRVLPVVNVISSYQGINFGQTQGFIPPDTCGAAGTNSYVETVNQTISIFSPKATGANSISDTFDDFWLNQGGLPKTDGNSFFSDPIVVWDDQVQRFIVGDQDVDFGTNAGNFDIAVSTSADPQSLTSSDWFFYQVSTNETGFVADYPGNFGYNRDAFVYTLNMFGSSSGHVLVTSLSINDLVAGNPITTFQNDLQDFSVRPTVMHDSQTGDDIMWLVSEHGDGQAINVYRMNNVLSNSARFTETTVPVTPYDNVVPPKQPDGSDVVDNIDSRILKAAEANDTIVATHAISVSNTEDDARWYAIDVSTGFPTLIQQGNISAGNHHYIYYPGIDINSNGDIGMSYMQSGTGRGEFMSVFVTGRVQSDPLNTMETPVLAQAGQQNYHDFGSPNNQRAGDLSGISVDSDGSFWISNEFADSERGSANWGTVIANFAVGVPPPTTDLAVSITAAATGVEGTNLVYSVTITNNGPADASNVILTDVLPAGISFVSANFPQGTVNVTGSIFTLTVPSLAAFTSLSGTITLTPTEEGLLTNTVSVTADNPDSNPANNQASAQTNLSDPAVVPTGGTFNIAEGSTADVVVATFRDPGGVEALTDYSASIDWGDGQTSAGTITVDAGTGLFSVHGSHAYVEEGTKSVSVTINHDSAPSATTTSTAQIADSSVIPTGNFTISATEAGDSGVQTVATFTDPGGAEALSDYSASINWGDGHTSAGVITVSAGVFTVKGSNTYSEEGSYTITVTIHHDTATDATATSTASVADVPVSAAGGFHITGTEGNDTGTVTVATFTDPPGAEALSEYSATITWGDGTSSAGTISFNSGTFTVQGHHAFQNAGSLIFFVTIHHGTATDVTVNDTADIGDPAVIPTGTSVSAHEGVLEDLVVATFTDPGGNLPVSHYSASIAWGDGQMSSGTISFDATSGIYSVHGMHAYPEEGLQFTISIVIHHDTAPDASATSTADVLDPAVVATGNFTVPATEGIDSGAQTVATFTDPGGAEALTDYSADIAWGDGHTSTGVIALSGGVFTVKGSNTYSEEGSYTIQVTIHHDTAPDASTTSTALVADQPVIGTGGLSISATEGSDTGTMTVATFTDPAGAEATGEYSATISWGDGSSSPGAIGFNSGTFTVTGSHVYQGEGALPVTVTIHHGTATDVTVTNSAQVVDPPVIATGGFTFNAVENATSASQTVATFTDPGGTETVNNYSADIAWGDGSTSAGTISVNGGVFSVSGSHKYTEEGTFSIGVTIHHALATDTTTMSSAVVSDPALVATGVFTVSATEGATSSSQTVATFTDPGGNELSADYSASIDWGDNTTPSAGPISFDSGTGVFTVSGSHLYAEEGSYAVRVTLHHDTATDVSVTSNATVADPPVATTGGFTFTAVEGVLSSAQTLATFTDPGGNEALGDYSASIDWGDTTSSVGQISFAGGVFTVTGSHGYAEEGSYSITVTIHHDTAADATATSSANVSDQPVQGTGGFAFAAVEGVLSASQTVATFTDPAGAEPVANYSAQITWGDGATSAGEISYDAATQVFSVKGAHTYAEEGNDAITVTLQHETAGDVVVASTATVADASLSFNGGATLSTSEGVAFTGAVATFTDGNPNAPLSDFAATIDWGDGTSTAGGILVASGTVVVSGSHIYAEDGNNTITVTLQDVGGQHASGQVTIVVAEPPINASPVAISGFEFTALTNTTLATFTHGGGLEPAGDFTVLVDWGDGSTSAGFAARSGMSYAALGSHTYTEEGTYSIRVTITDDSASTTFRTTATMLEELLPDGTRGTPSQRWLSETYRTLLGRKIDPVGLANGTAALVHGTSRTDLVRGIESSLEYRTTLVNSIYFSLLGRAVDPVGLDMSLRILGGTPFLGGPPTIEQLKAIILGSPEYFAKHGSTNAGFLQGLYHDVLGRSIDTGAFSGRAVQLAQGTSRYAEAMQILTSPEAYMVLTEYDYRTYLHRDADPAGLAGWVNALMHGMRDEDVLASVIASDEFFAQTVQ
jgi:uncharacterized repeat protein (TIGR01451 family)